MRKPQLLKHRIDQTLSKVFSGTQPLTWFGPGTLTLSGANSYTGTTTINAGTLKTQGSAFSTTARTWSIATGAVLDIDGRTNPALGTTTINGTGTLQITGGGFGNSIGPGYNIVMAMGSGGLIDVQSGSKIFNGGWASIGWTANLASLNLDGTFDMTDGNDVYIDALTGSGLFTKTAGTVNNVQIGVNNGSGVFSGIISNQTGTLNLIKNGTGTQTLSGANTYTGGTTISAGILTISNASGLGTGAVSVNGTLTYTVDTTGTRTVTVNSGGVINKGGFTHTGTTFVNNGGTINA